ncbi:MAG TPA: TonB-dependent receptor [Bryobacteraceae bacterium]|nr:TonB-dependent receptor [Bryobacteraceae bacterium]
MRLILLMMSAGWVLLGQAPSGGAAIEGAVKDSSGLVVAGARLTFTNLDTGDKSTLESNRDGYFTTPPVQIGKYRVRCEAAGMKAWEQEVTLETGQTVAIAPVLSPGAVSQTVMVTEEIPQITTTEPTDATTLDSQRIKELPINGRDLNTLLSEVTPGVEQVIDVNGGVRSGGLMVYSTTYTQDGASANNREFGGSTGLQGLESIGEVRVETSTGNAKSSTPTSVMITTRSGTNRIHFSLYETIRNNAWGVARHREDVNPNGAPFQLPKLIRNEYGGFIGAPVMLPTFGINGRKIYDGHNRTFFMVARDSTALRQGVTKSYSVPTQAMRNGDFSGLETSTALPITIYDPLTGQSQTQNNRVIIVRQPFPNNVIPLNRESPLAKYVYGITPLPTDITEPNITSNLKYSFPTNGLGSLNDNPITIRVDHRIGDNDHLYGKTNWGTRTAYFQGTGGSTGVPTSNLAANVTYLPMQSWAAGINETHSFGSGLFVETVINRTWQTTKTIDGPPNQQQDWASTLGLPNPYGQVGWPSILNVGTNFTQYVEGDNRRALGSTITNSQQNWSLVRGTHNIQFGGAWHDEVQRLEPDQGNISGTANFNSMATALESSTLGSTTSPSAVPNTGFDAANFFLGYAANYNVYLSRGVMKVDEKNYSLYLQDNYKASDRLTLTPGLRWDINPAFNDEHHLINSFDTQNHAIILPEPMSYYYRIGATTPQVVSSFEKVNVTFETAQQAGRPTNLFSHNYFDFGPRMGAAYRVWDGRRQFVIRGGYGMYISLLPMRTLLAQFSSMAPFKANFSYNPNSAAQSPDGISNWLLRNAPVYIAGVSSTNSVDVASPNSLGIGQSIVALSPDQPNAKIHEWNVEIEKEIGHGMVVRLRYDGRHAWNLDQLSNINPQASDYIWYTETHNTTPTGSYSSVLRRPYDQNAYTDIKFLAKTGMSNSEMGAVEVARRFNHGLQFQFFYTLTNAYRLAGNSFRDSPGAVPSQFLPGTVPTSFDGLNRFLSYARDTGVPKHRVRWNWIYDLPFGHGRALATSAPKWLNAAIGGWTLSGSGTIVSSWFALDSSENTNFAANSDSTYWWYNGNAQVYGKKYEITDCTATPATARTIADARCYAGYLYWNGYISQKYIDSYNAYGIPNGIFGLPSNYKPAAAPVNPWPVGGKTTDANAANYDTNYVNITLNNNSVVRVRYDTGLAPLRNQYLLGPINWNVDSSLRKVFQLTENARLQVAFDVFNVFNLQGTNPPGANGISSLQTSFSGFGFQPRQAQGSFRLQW